jgi:hypothetical protein
MPRQTAWEIRDAGSGERVIATQPVERLADDLKLAFYRRSERCPVEASCRHTSLRTPLLRLGQMGGEELTGEQNGRHA